MQSQLPKKISAKVICKSYNPELDSTITTFELEYQRLIHSELMTHRVFSRNAASSRAIPVKSIIEMVRNDPAMPVHWGKNQPGMKAKEELEGLSRLKAEVSWKESANASADTAEYMTYLGLHKQVVNRILEPYQWMKTVLTTTNLNNFFWLRDHEDADPNIRQLAELMLEEYNTTPATELRPGEWHIPYVKKEFKSSRWLFYDENENLIGIDEALKISASCCAQTSYRKQDSSMEKAEDIYKKLIESEPVHASPVEHQAMAIAKRDDPMDYFKLPGVTSIDRNSIPWSGNFHGFVQYRQLIPNNAKKY